MARQWRLIGDEIRRVVADPTLLRKASPRAMTARVRAAMTSVPAAGGWTERADGMRARAYDDYDDYVEHQKSKLGLMRGIDEYNGQLRNVLRQRLSDGSWQGTRVLCLAARRGGEVQAFRDLGAFAIGIDLNPGPDNAFVCYGDFHQLEYPDGTVDAVYTNSLDHAFDLHRLAAEVRRVLTPDGTFLVDAVAGDDGAVKPGHWEATWWQSVDALLRPILDAGFREVSRAPFTNPWAGVELTLAPSAAR